MVEALKVRPPDLARPVGTLSGGNQQKVLIGRWLIADCSVILFYDVTRGVDIATKHEIYQLSAGSRARAARSCSIRATRRSWPILPTV